MDKKNKRRGTAKKGKIIAIALSVAAVAGVVFFLLSPSEEEETVQYITYQAQTGNIETKVNGSGSISSASTTAYNCLSSGTGTKVSAQSGDMVESGDLIAVLTSSATNSKQFSSIEDAMTEDTMSFVKLYTYSSGITKVMSPVKGRVKMLSVIEGDDVSVVQENSVLCVVSSDGDMYVEFTPAEGVTLTASQEVEVMVGSDAADGEVIKTGSQGMAKVLIETDIYDQGTQATIYDKDGNEIGAGELMINAPVAVVATGGYVSSLYVEENEKVSKDSTLMKLVQTGLDTGYTCVLSVVAPSDGILSDLAISEGSALESGTQMFSLLSADAYTLTVSVDELDIASVEIGQNATVSVDALSDRAFTGTVQSVSSVGTNSGGVATYDVIISLDTTEGILPGMSASADIQTAYKENVVIVPVDALITRNGKNYVLSASAVENVASTEVLTADNNDYIEVQTGITDGTYIEIISGLGSGEEIAYAQSTYDGSSTNAGGLMMNNLDVGGGMPYGGSRPEGAPGGGE